MEEEKVMTIAEILSATGLSMADLSRRFDIPYRTVQDWAKGRRECAEYIRKMIIQLL